MSATSTPLIGILMLLFTVSACAAAALAFVVFKLQRRPIGPLVFTITLGLGGWTLLYAGTLVATSLASEARVLGLNENKVFCGFYIDCHMQLAVVHVDTVRAIGIGNPAVTPIGMFYVITLRASSSAARAHMRLLTPKLVVRDGTGRVFARALSAEVALAAAGAPSTPLTETVDPDGSFLTTAVFDVAVDAKDLTLDVTDGYAIDRAIEAVLIGDEDSFLHKRTRFRLPS
jgi:hypothetical protein